MIIIFLDETPNKPKQEEDVCLTAECTIAGMYKADFRPNEKSNLKFSKSLFQLETF